MKILEIIPDITDGGAQRFVVDLCNEFITRENVKVYLVSLYGIKEKHYFAKELNKNIIVFQLDKKPGFDKTILFKLYKIIKEVKPDIIHSHLSAIKYIIPLVLFIKSKVIHTIHTNPKREPIDKITRFFLKKLYDYKKIIPITISKDSSESYGLVYKNNNNIEIFNGRPTVNRSEKFNDVMKKINSLKKTKNTKVFLHIARISKVKNQLLLVNVFNKLINEGKDIILIMIGSFNNKEITDKILEIKNKNIILLGTVKNPIDYLFLSDAFCLTSFVEGMPITLIEAFQTGCIPVCTPSGGIKNMIKNDINGLLAEAISEKAFEKAVNKFLSLPKIKVKSMQENCLATYREYYHITYTASEYLKLFNNHLT